MKSIEDKLWAAVDKLRGHIDASQYKEVLLSLIFLKYISDAFEERRAAILQIPGADPEDRDKYTAERIFWVPEEARWSVLQAQVRQPTTGNVVDRAMEALERENPSLKGVFPKNFGRPPLDKARLGELVDLLSSIGQADAASRSQDVLVRAYGYLLGNFAADAGKSGGEFYTPQSVAKLLVEMIEPIHGRVFDPCCGSGSMLVSCELFVLAHGGCGADLTIFGQEWNPATWRLAKMNLAIRGINANLGPGPADSLHRDLHPDLKADFVLANPPFNGSGWGRDRLRQDERWVYGVPPAGNANYAWIQHFLYHLSPRGIAGFVMSNGSLSSNQVGEREIRKGIVEADLVDCMVALPGQLFFTTGVPACLWLLNRDKQSGRFHSRGGNALFIDARRLGTMNDRVHRELTDADIEKIAGTYHAWSGRGSFPSYKDVPGFCKSASLEEIRQNSYVLAPGRYVGSPAAEEEQSVETRMKRLTALLREQNAKARKLDTEIWKNLERLGYGETET